jgi:hypothetical protein
MTLQPPNVPPGRRPSGGTQGVRPRGGVPAQEEDDGGGLRLLLDENNSLDGLARYFQDLSALDNLMARAAAMTNGRHTPLRVASVHMASPVEITITWQDATGTGTFLIALLGYAMTARSRRRYASARADEAEANVAEAAARARREDIEADAASENLRARRAIVDALVDHVGSASTADLQGENEQFARAMQAIQALPVLSMTLLPPQAPAPQLPPPFPSSPSSPSALQEGSSSGTVLAEEGVPVAVAEGEEGEPRPRNPRYPTGASNPGPQRARYGGKPPRRQPGPGRPDSQD